MKIAVLAIFLGEFAKQTQGLYYRRHPWRRFGASPA
jgi:hypothetical protein